MTYKVKFAKNADNEFISYKSGINQWEVDGDVANIRGLSIDPSTLKTGWGLIQEGQAPHWVWDEVPGTAGPRPGQGYKHGFAIATYLNDYGWRDWNCQNANGVRTMESILSQIGDQIDNNTGKIASFEFTGTAPTTIGRATVNVAQLQFRQWSQKPVRPEKPDSDQGNQQQYAQAPAPQQYAQAPAPQQYNQAPQGYNEPPFPSNAPTQNNAPMHNEDLEDAIPLF